MIKLGITGGIGSGKSVVCSLLELYGVPVYDSDFEAKRLMNEVDLIKTQLTALFGSDAYRDGCLNAPFIAQRVFLDSSLLQQINAIVHPAVFEDFDRWCDDRADSPVVACESAILFECGLDRLLTHTLRVVAPMEQRIARVMKRTQLTRQQVLQRIANQATDAQLPTTDFVVVNDDRLPLIPQVNNFLGKVSKP